MIMVIVDFDSAARVSVMLFHIALPDSSRKKYQHRHTVSLFAATNSHIISGRGGVPEGKLPHPPW